MYDPATGKVETDINAILRTRSEEWARVWLCHDKAKVIDTRNAVKEACSTVNDEHNNAPIFTATELRAAANTFKKNTAIGLDLCTFKEIQELDDIALDKLGRIITDNLRGLSPPLQSMQQLHNLLGKKNGGQRTITTMTTLHRLTMRLRSDEERQWNNSISSSDNIAHINHNSYTVDVGNDWQNINDRP